MSRDMVNNMPKIDCSLLAALFGAYVGTLSGHFAWSLIGAVGLWSLAYIAKNLAIVSRRIVSANDQTTLLEIERAELTRIDRGTEWLHKWNEDMDFCPTYKNSPGNIWRDPKWASDD